MADTDSTPAVSRGNLQVADLIVRADHAERAVVLEVRGPDDDGVQLALSPERALEVALRVAAAVAKLMRLVDQ
jgi:hypothetical protein